MRDINSNYSGGKREPSGYEPWGERRSLWRRIRKMLGAAGVVLLVGLKFFGKIKFLLLPALKFLPVLLKTGGTMVLSVGAYAMAWGWKFALGFVLLMFVHESGHLLAARRLGLKVGAPVFIPFMGALIAMKEAPRDAWVEARIGLGGPLIGGLGALACLGLYFWTGQPLYSALAYTGFFLNLFNLLPVGFLDGGRVVSAISLWLWLIGAAIAVALLIFTPNLVLFLILLLTLPHAWRCFANRKTAYYQVPLGRRVIMAAIYFGLIVLLTAGMDVAHVVAPQS